ncbi:MAG TPA: Hsp20/alpha crystallin family protein [Candidatus Acidoferrales bacterium]|nr:Hsp20/alpha crystallin family protein [Candidatus Acidoferrales bacterium]
MAWDPFTEVETLRREIDRVFNQFGLEAEPFSRVAFLPARGPRQYPLINTYEDKDNLYIEALAPGVDPASLDVSVLRNTLTISGEKRQAAAGVRPEAFHRNERASGRFIRSLELPIEVEENEVRAEYKDGLLLLTLPKAAKAKPKQISVAVA